jgi:hypothetical protein
LAVVDVTNSSALDLLVSTLRPVRICLASSSTTLTAYELENTTFVETTDSYYYRSLADISYQDVRDRSTGGTRLAAARRSTYDSPVALDTRLSVVYQNPKEFSVQQEIISLTQMRVFLTPQFFCEEVEGARYSEAFTLEPWLNVTPSDSVVFRSFTTQNLTMVVERANATEGEVVLSYLDWQHTVSWVPTSAPTPVPTVATNPTKAPTAPTLNETALTMAEIIVIAFVAAVMSGSIVLALFVALVRPSFPMLGKLGRLFPRGVAKARKLHT